MTKWYEEACCAGSSVVYSRIRISRNWESHLFPSRMEPEERKETLELLREGLKEGLGEEREPWGYRDFSQMNELERQALKERRILNTSAVSERGPAGLFLSGDESRSMILCGDDHIRLQLLGAGLKLDELWRRADSLDDGINEKFPYAFDEKYGYLTSYPTNTGTGLRACAILHLPTLSMGKKFSNMLAELSRFGVTIRGVYGEGSENYGALYEVANQKTLGQSEKEIVELVTKIARQLDTQERKVRRMALENHRLEREDEAYKSYGILKYARRLTKKDAMIFLSQLMAGMADRLIRTEEPCSVYRLMLGIQTANLQKLSSKPLNQEELDVARAAYLRRELPLLKEQTS